MKNLCKAHYFWFIHWLCKCQSSSRKIISKLMLMSWMNWPRKNYKAFFPFCYFSFLVRLFIKNDFKAITIYSRLNGFQSSSCWMMGYSLKFFFNNVVAHTIWSFQTKNGENFNGRKTKSNNLRFDMSATNRIFQIMSKSLHG